MLVRFFWVAFFRWRHRLSHAFQSQHSAFHGFQSLPGEESHPQAWTRRYWCWLLLMSAFSALLVAKFGLYSRHHNWHHNWLSRLLKIAITRVVIVCDRNEEFGASAIQNKKSHLPSSFDRDPRSCPPQRLWHVPNTQMMSSWMDKNHPGCSSKKGYNLSYLRIRLISLFIS